MNMKTDVKLLNHIWSIDNLTQNDKNILCHIALACALNHDKKVIIPIPTIASELSLATKTVYNRLLVLKQKNYINIEYRQSPQGADLPNCYHITNSEILSIFD